MLWTAATLKQNVEKGGGDGRETAVCQIMGGGGGRVGGKYGGGKAAGYPQQL